MTALSTPNTELESGEIAAGETTSQRQAGPRPPVLAVVDISPALRSWRRTLGDLWQRREIVGYLAWRDIQARYHQTTLGVLWALLQPLAATLVYAVVFGRLVKIRSGEVPYPLFVMTGLLFWQFIASAIQRSASSLVANGGVIRKVYFPRLAIPLAAVVASLVEFAAAAGRRDRDVADVEVDIEFLVLDEPRPVEAEWCAGHPPAQLRHLRQTSRDKCFHRLEAEIRCVGGVVDR